MMMAARAAFFSTCNGLASDKSQIHFQVALAQKQKKSHLPQDRPKVESRQSQVNNNILPLLEGVIM